MSLLDSLRKGFGYVLLSMGVSRPQPKRESERPTPSAPNRPDDPNPENSAAKSAPHS